MRVYRDIKGIARCIKILKRRGKVIGFVPTMGYLHEGHLSLMRVARKECDVSIISIFVNPTQFGPKEDYKKYPRDFKRDQILARKAGVDIIFLPTPDVMYPIGYKTYVDVEDITRRLCGASRPGHFRGVSTVVAKLFNIVQPDIAYFGQKDAQQAIVIKRMAEDLNVPVKVKVLPVVRKPDGLAMSSRNKYLSSQERKDAAVLSQSLKVARRLIKNGERNASRIKKAMGDVIKTKKSAHIDYVSIVDTKDLKEVKSIGPGSLIALAVRIGKTRLIDNMQIKWV